MSTPSPNVQHEKLGWLSITVLNGHSSDDSLGDFEVVDDGDEQDSSNLV